MYVSVYYLQAKNLNSNMMSTKKLRLYSKKFMRAEYIVRSWDVCQPAISSYAVFWNKKIQTSLSDIG